MTAEELVCVGASAEPRLWYLDADGDGFGGDTATLEPSCAPPSEGYVDRSGDCQDFLLSVNPDGLETCNGFLQLCFGHVAV